jgi:hypothetical protein
MEPRRYDETEEEAGQGRVELSEAQAHALTRLGQAMRVLGLIQAVVAGAALLLLLTVIAAVLFLGPLVGPGPSLLEAGFLAHVFLALLVFQLAAPTFQGVLVAGAAGDLQAVADPKQRAQPRLIKAFARMRSVFLLEVIVALMLLVKELKFAV